MDWSWTEGSWKFWNPSITQFESVSTAVDIAEYECKIMQTTTHITILYILLRTVMAKETYCPPPMKKFLRINSKVFRKMNGATINVKGEPQEEVVRMSLVDNPYYSSPKCGLLETKDSKGIN